MESDLIRKSLLELELAIAGKDVSPVELVDAYLAEITAHDESLNVYVTVTADRAREEARALTEELARTGPRGPLHGIPFAAKDLMDTAGVRTTYGSAVFADHVPDTDAEPVRRLRAAGAILLGKTNTHEFACGATTNNPHYGATHNPWKQGHVPGGSSGGSAAAVAAGLAPLATGSDTGGSIRMPSAACGVVGLKPTWGRVSLRGTFPMATTFDHVGPIARSARDCAIAMNALGGFDPEDPWSPRQGEEEYTRLLGRKVEGRRIGYDPGFRPVPVQAAVWENLEKTLRCFEELGCDVVEVKLPDAGRVLQTGFELTSAETAYAHRELLPGNEQRYGDDVRGLIQSGQSVDGMRVLAGQHRRMELARAFENVVTADVHALVLPTLALEAPRIGQDTVEIEGVALDVTLAMAAFTMVHNTTRLPSVSVPSGLGPGGLPTAIQIATGPYEDTLALGLADALETALWPPSQRWPTR